MFKTALFATALVAVNARYAADCNSCSYGYAAPAKADDCDSCSYGYGYAAKPAYGYGSYGYGKDFTKDCNSLDQFQTEAYGADNQHYGHQGYGYGGCGHSHGNDSWKASDDHNSHRTSGHQGQGHNQWVDNAWNQWGTNNHWDNQKYVDNKWGNNSGKINVTVNSVSGHYDQSYGNQSRGMGYLGHQNVSGEIGYQVGLAGHSFGYDKGDHPVGYDNDQDYGYGGWANNLGAWNHGANYDNFGDRHIDTGRGTANEGSDSYGVKRDRRAGYGYADLDELDDEEPRTNQYGNFRVGVDTRAWGHTDAGVYKPRSTYNRGYGNYGGYGYGDRYGGYGGYGYGKGGYPGYDMDRQRDQKPNYNRYGRPLGGDYLGRSQDYGCQGGYCGGYKFADKLGYNALNWW